MTISTFFFFVAVVESPDMKSSLVVAVVVEGVPQFVDVAVESIFFVAVVDALVKKSLLVVVVVAVEGVDQSFVTGDFSSFFFSSSDVSSFLFLEDDDKAVLEVVVLVGVLQDAVVGGPFFSTGFTVDFVFTGVEVGGALKEEDVVFCSTGESF